LGSDVLSTWRQTEPDQEEDTFQLENYVNNNAPEAFPADNHLLQRFNVMCFRNDRYSRYTCSCSHEFCDRQIPS